MYFILRKVSRYGLRPSRGGWHSILGEEGRGRLDLCAVGGKTATIGWLEGGYGLRRISGDDIRYDRTGVRISGFRRYNTVLFVWACQRRLSIAVKHV
jgi:hypothetical protein